MSLGFSLCRATRWVQRSAIAFGFCVLIVKTEKCNFTFFSIGFRSDYFLDAPMILTGNEKSKVKNTAITSLTYFKLKLCCI